MTIVIFMTAGYFPSSIRDALILILIVSFVVAIFSIIRVKDSEETLGEIEQQVKKLTLQKALLESSMAAKKTPSASSEEVPAQSQVSVGTNGQTHATDKHVSPINSANTVDTTSTTATQSDYVSQRAALRLKLVNNFGEEELRTLCFDLGVDYESISDDNKDIFVRELLILFDRRGNLKQLIAYCRRLRPNIDWEKN